MQRSVSSGMLCIKRTMPSVRSCPARMHTTPLLAPVAKPWSVVAAHVRCRVDDTYLVSVRLARAVEGLRSARPTTLKMQSRYSPRMSDPPPALADLPSLEYETPPFFSLKKVRELEIGYINRAKVGETQEHGGRFQDSGFAAVAQAADY